jgi:hypothetical protein
MLAYEFFWNDKNGKTHFIGSLPERRKNPERITWDSIMNWGKMMMGDGGENHNIFFVKTEM